MLPFLEEAIAALCLDLAVSAPSLLFLFEAVPDRILPLFVIVDDLETFEAVFLFLNSPNHSVSFFLVDLDTGPEVLH